jgi:hypothetical protein
MHLQLTQEHIFKNLLHYVDIMKLIFLINNEFLKHKNYM